MILAGPTSISSPIMLDETGKAIVEALTQKDMTQQRINEIKSATDEQLARIPEVTALSENLVEIDSRLSESINEISDKVSELEKMPEFSGTPTVGQIYKVSAVDAGGRVTMEPANLPSGYILVASTITTEEITRWTVTSSADGGPFRFKNLLAYIRIPSSMTPTNFEMDFDDTYGIEIRLGYSGSYQNSILKIDTFPDDFLIIDFASYDYSGKQGNIQQKKGRKIENRFRLYSYGGVALPIGTELYLWGRRSE